MHGKTRQMESPENAFTDDAKGIKVEKQLISKK